MNVSEFKMMASHMGIAQPADEAGCSLNDPPDTRRRRLA